MNNTAILISPKSIGVASDRREINEKDGKVLSFKFQRKMSSGN